MNDRHHFTAPSDLDPPWWPGTYAEWKAKVDASRGHWEPIFARQEQEWRDWCAANPTWAEKQRELVEKPKSGSDCNDLA